MEKKNELREARSLEEMQLGVWRVLTEKDIRGASVGFAARWKKITALLPAIQRFATDVYSVGPGLLFLIVLSKVWSAYVFWSLVGVRSDSICERSVEDVLLLHLANKVLSVIEVGLREGKPDTAAIANAVVARVVVVAISAAVQWLRIRATSIMENRCFHYFEDLIFSSNLRADLPTIHDNDADESLSAKPIWDHFINVMDVGETGIQAVSLLAYIFQIAVSSQHGPVFVLLCLCKPVIRVFLWRSLWEKAHVVEATDSSYIRLRALKDMGGEKYRQDIISGNIGEYILREHAQAREELGETSMGAAWQIYEATQSFGLRVTMDLAGDLTMLYYAWNAVFGPEKFTLASIAMLQHSESILRRTFSSGINQIGELRQSMNFMKRIYGITKVTNVIQDGTLPYPANDQSEMAGMSIDLRNVSFSYPGSTSKKALDDVTISIKSGQLVVLVGANGSGKSSLVKLLARLYDATSGQVLIGGQDIRHYRLMDLRGATASLTQDHHLYPLSLAENIGLGHPSLSWAEILIRDAARKGGADNFVSKLTEGFSTVLDSKDDQYSMHVDSKAKTPLSKVKEDLTKAIDISGGERQRVVASRTFMRFTSGTVKLVIADEGSSALDPQGEWELFKNLREERQGKTMVFVTHRFGHLTKYADLILCMKDGRLVETGSHEELMKNPEGEYSKLYDRQAKAFTTGVE
ncbi:P-loop containing nucleoside triphosphate hydrolase protein [Mycena sanguinolenta]|nr:P-loop containing nucleoside triphosphate hydrolase protein [Mycena sanguinolenta]